MTIYPIAFLSVIVTLSLWYYYQKREKSTPLLQLAVYVSLAAWLGSLFLANVSTEVKFPLFLRDIILMIGVPVVVKSFAKSKTIFFGLLTLLIGVYYGFGWDIWEQSLSSPQTENTIENKRKTPVQDDTYELLAELRNQSQLTQLEALSKEYDFTFKMAFHPKNGIITDLDDYVAINIPNDQIAEQNKIISALQAAGLVDWVEQNEVINIDDPMVNLRKLPAVNKKLGVNDPDLNKQWALTALQTEKLYEVLRQKKYQASRKARVFVLDTGVDSQHEDLASNYKSVQGKYDKDVQGHGTHCAGIIGALSNNGKGIASFSQNNNYIQITSIKVLSDFGGGTQSRIINGMIEAADAGADVISMSLGGRSSDIKQRAYKQAVDYCNDAGAIVVVAAGNSNANAKNYAPAGAPGVICVSAIDTLFNKANFSNTVEDVKMGIAAPGTMIYSTFPKNQYKAFNGTSMATPFVAGLIGIMKSIEPDLTTKEVYKILNKTGLQSKSDKQTGKIIQPAAAIKEL